MKKILILLMATTFCLALFTNPALARRRGHHAPSYGHGYHHHDLDALAIGLGAAMLGAAIANSAQPQREVIIERRYYSPSPPPPSRHYRRYRERSHHPHGRNWVPGRYISPGGGPLVYIPGHYE